MQIFDLPINMVKVGRRSITDTEQFKPKYHVIPSIPQSLNDLYVLIQSSKGILIRVCRLERSILLEISLKIEGFLQKIIFILVGLIMEVRTDLLVSFLDLQQHLIIMHPSID